VDQGSNQRQQQQEEEEFMKKHNSFMRKVLTKFIQHNEERQSLYEQEKKFLRKNAGPVTHLRTLSEPRKEKKKEKENDVNPEHQFSERALATKGSMEEAEEMPKDETSGVLPKLQPRKKKEKFKIRRDSSVEAALLSRKLGTPPSKASVRKGPVEEKLDFREDIVDLQLMQANKLEIFADKVEKQIA
jgi:hypothetical protein